MDPLTEQQRIKLATSIVNYLRNRYSGHYDVGERLAPNSLSYIDLGWGDCDILEWVSAACDEDD